MAHDSWFKLTHMVGTAQQQSHHLSLKICKLVSNVSQLTGISDTEDISGETVPVMTRFEGLSPLDSALCYVKQLAEATLLDTMAACNNKLVINNK